ncbi:hypothetical protein [Actinocorallia populi]|uniref:hypothetical protein n=1 Tax=Actinocorallia populi TaxID=2079200 RepID=UPI0018E50F6C|nr:hypothetical protein [Actinocorallia populi]
MLVAMIVGAEIAFWVVLALGLLARYGLRTPRLGGALLLAVPLVDLFLLTATFLDLRGGGEAGTAHGLAAIYLGVSVGFGHQIIKRMDAWAAHRFAGAPRPVKPAKGGPARARYEAAQFGRHLLAWAVGSVLLLLGIWYVGDAGRTEALLHLVGLWALILVIDGAVTAYDVAGALRNRNRGGEPSREAGSAPRAEEASGRR